MPTPRQLLAPTAASVTDATLFTSQSAGVTVIRQIIVANTTNGASVTFGIAIGGTTATAANLITGGAVQPIPANSVIVIPGPITLPASTAVHAIASITGVTFEISGDIY